MEYKDYYKIMGVDKTASQDEIKRAYRKLARKYHPDVSKSADAEEKFKELGEAYEALKDPEKRAAYDQLGKNWKAGQNFNPPPDWDAGFEFHGGGFTEGTGDFSDFFESLFGQQGGYRETYTQRGSRTGQSQRGQDSHAKVLIDLEDSYRGTSRSLTLHATEPGPDGLPRLKERTLTVKIPKGVKQGQHIRLQGQGNPAIGSGQPGDLYLEIEFNPHSHYRVEGRDVYYELPVTPWEAALGSSIAVPIPDGNVEMKIPAGSSSGRKLRVKNRGIPGKTPGDFYVTLKIIIPDSTSPEAKKLYEKLEQLHTFNPRAATGA